MYKFAFALLLAFSLSLFSSHSVYADTTFKVLKVIDGDTIQVNVRGKRETVRLLGIDAPESVDPNKPVQCFATAATKKMKSFVSGKPVILIDDRTQGNRDKHQRLLRYVYLPDNSRTFVNGEMVKQGYAYSYREYPTKFLNDFNSWETNARNNNLGLWGACTLTVAPTKKPVTRTNTAPTYIAPTKKVYVAPTKIYVAPVVDTSTSTNINPPANAGGGFDCAGKTKCGEMTSCEEARYYLNSCGVSRLDGDSDGTPCETLCR